jgi:GNAT superfamily N-acetyltransferase
VTRVGRTSYLRTAALSGVVLLGWLWDAALGGGRAHALGWLVALLVVGAISVLSVHAARRTARDQAVAGDQAGGGAQAADSGTQTADVSDAADLAAGVHSGPIIRLAEPADLVTLPALESSADTLFTVAGYGRPPGPASVDELQSALVVLVAGRPPQGFLWLVEVAGCAHLEGVSVALTAMKRGLGGALLEAACDWAWAAGFDTMTLTTFADVPWNAPFYAKRGFVELPDPGPELRAVRRREQVGGLDDLGRRIVMSRRLPP